MMNNNDNDNNAQTNDVFRIKFSKAQNDLRKDNFMIVNEIKVRNFGSIASPPQSPPLRVKPNAAFDIEQNTILRSSYDRVTLNTNFQNKSPLPPINLAPQGVSSTIGNTNGFIVSWKNLSYTVNGKNQRIVLNNLCGHFKSNELTALMGPSGAGKTSLLESICGKKARGVSGDVRIRGIDTISISFVPQFDSLLESLTVMEILIFASKLREATVKSIIDHNVVIEKLLNRFNLKNVSETLISLCSGGQKKRISIAIEVIRKPNVMILDEPTTGLDSPSCTTLNNVMRELVSGKRPTAIVATIHQPSMKVFNEFDHLYILSNDGQCIYEGSPLTLLNTLSSVGLHCQSFNTPVDFIIEVAAGDYDREVIDKLINIHKKQDMTQLVTAGTKLLKDSIKQEKHPLMAHTNILFQRSVLTTYRIPTKAIFRVIMSIVFAILLPLISEPDIGAVSGCPPTKYEIYTTDMIELTNRFSNNMYKIGQNIGMFFIGLMIALMGAIGPVAMTFPLEMQTFIKEYQNDWYSCAAFYFSRVFIDLPLQIITPAVYFAITYLTTGQPLVLFRPFGLMFLAVLLGLTGQSIGESASAIWCYNLNAAAFISGMIPLPMILFGGFLVKISRMPSYLRPLSWLSFLRFAFEGMMLVMYGYGRCQYEYEKIESEVNISALEKPQWIQMLPLIASAIDKTSKNYTDINDYDYDENKNDGNEMEILFKFFASSLSKSGDFDINKSSTLLFFDLTDADLYRSIIILVSYLIFFRIATYFILLMKVKSKR